MERGKFKLSCPGSGTEYGFVVAAYDKQRPLIIDPVLVYSTYLVGSSDDNISGVAVDQQGNVYVTGQTHSSTDLTTLAPKGPVGPPGRPPAPSLLKELRLPGTDPQTLGLGMRRKPTMASL